MASPPPLLSGSPWACVIATDRGRGHLRAVIQERLARNIMEGKWALDALSVFPLNPVRFHFMKWLLDPICAPPVSHR